jgi:hypothetical protein
MVSARKISIDATCDLAVETDIVAASFVAVAIYFGFAAVETGASQAVFEIPFRS